MQYRLAEQGRQGCRRIAVVMWRATVPVRILHERTNTQDFYAQRRKLLQDNRFGSLPFDDDEITE